MSHSQITGYRTGSVNHTCALEGQPWTSSGYLLFHSASASSVPSLYLLSWVTQNSIEFLSQWPVNSIQVFLRLVPCIEFAVIAGHPVANDGRNVRIIPGKLSIFCAFYVLTMADTDIDGRVQGTCIAIGKNTIQGCGCMRPPARIDHPSRLVLEPRLTLS